MFVRMQLSWHHPAFLFFCMQGGYQVQENILKWDYFIIIIENNTTKEFVTQSRTARHLNLALVGHLNLGKRRLPFKILYIHSDAAYPYMLWARTY